MAGREEKRVFGIGNVKRNTNTNMLEVKERLVEILQISQISHMIRRQGEASQRRHSGTATL